MADGIIMVERMWEGELRESEAGGSDLLFSLKLDTKTTETSTWSLRTVPRVPAYLPPAIPATSFWAVQMERGIVVP